MLLILNSIMCLTVSTDVEKSPEGSTPSDEVSHKSDQLSMPDDLDYIEKPHQQSFQSEGGLFRHFEKYGFSLIIPPLAVPEGKEIKLKVGLCCYGPFSISDKYLLASDFAIIVTDNKFSKPVEVFMDHSLILPEYKRCSEVVILRADHHKVTKDGLYTFDRFTIPEIESNSPRVSFRSVEFCILCAVLTKENGQSTPFSSTSSDIQSLAHIDDGNLSSATSNFDTDTMEFERSLSADSPLMVMRAHPAPSDLESSSPTRKRKSESLEDHPVSLLKRPGGKSSTTARRAIMKRAHHRSSAGGSIEKKHCAIEYAALLLQPKDKIFDSDDLYRFIIFICINCSGAHKVR